MVVRMQAPERRDNSVASAIDEGNARNMGSASIPSPKGLRQRTSFLPFLVRVDHDTGQVGWKRTKRIAAFLDDHNMIHPSYSVSLNDGAIRVL